MIDDKTKLSFGETAGLLGYGFKLMAKTTPAYLPLMLIRALLNALQPLLVLFFSARVLNELDSARDVQAIITFVSLAVGSTFIISALKAFLTRALETRTEWWLLFQRMQLLMAEQFSTMDFAYAEDSKISEALARMEIQARGNGLGFISVYLHCADASEKIFTLILSVLLLTGTFSEGLYLSGWPVPALCGVFALGLILNFFYQKRARAVTERIYADNAAANTSAEYYSNYIKSDQAAKDIRLYDQSAALFEIFKSSLNSKSWVSFFFFQGRLDGFMIGLLAVISGGFYLVAGYGALDGSVAVGGIVQSVGAATALAASAGSLISLIGRMINNAAFLKPMRDYLSLPDLLVKGAKTVPPPGDHDYLFEFRNVSFRYPGAADYALKNLDLVFPPGERLAVVGLNGSGKTTMVKLLCRLYDPTEGEILLDGVNIKEYDYGQYIALFSVVFQDYALFPLALGQNVAASGRVDAARAEESLRSAGFGTRLAAMREGMGTILYKDYDEDGTQISGGEAQKIALARALYKDAPFVVLDEPTAALDPIAEYEVYTTFDDTIGNKTAVFISHRLSSCRFCHRIAVFDGGRLTQLGTHEELLGDAEGRYRELWEAQASHYSEDSSGKA